MTMNTPTLLAISFAIVGFSAPAHAAGASKTSHQLTGTVAEVNDAKIVIQKGKSKSTWEIARNAATKVTGDLKVGANVSIQYTMTATAVEVKPADTAPTENKKP